MTAVTVITLNRDEFKALLFEAAIYAVQHVAERTGELMTVAQLAAHYHCTERTIRNREKAGDLPRRNGRTWRRADVLAWDSDRLQTPA